jgi:hypothetical protein
MGLEIGSLFQTMVSAGEGLGSDVWGRMRPFAIPELHKIAIQIVAIAENVEDYTPAGAKALFDMQIKASLGVLAGMTELTLLAVQNAINRILDAIRSMVSAALPFPLF